MASRRSSDTSGEMPESGIRIGPTRDRSTLAPAAPITLTGGRIRRPGWSGEAAATITGVSRTAVALAALLAVAERMPLAAPGPFDAAIPARRCPASART